MYIWRGLVLMLMAQAIPNVTPRFTSRARLPAAGLSLCRFVFQTPAAIAATVTTLSKVQFLLLGQTAKFMSFGLGHSVWYSINRSMVVSRLARTRRLEEFLVAGTFQWKVSFGRMECRSPELI